MGNLAAGRGRVFSKAESLTVQYVKRTDFKGTNELSNANYYCCCCVLVK